MVLDAMITLPRTLSDEDLAAAITKLVRGERETTASLIAHIMEFDARRLYLGAGCPSMFAYCTDVLRLSGHEAYHRIEAARLTRRFPVVLQMLADGALNLTTARLLGPHLEEDNHEVLLASAVGKSKREVQRLLAQRFPQPDVPTLIRKLPAPRAAEGVGDEPAVTTSVGLPLEMSPAPTAVPLEMSAAPMAVPLEMSAAPLAVPLDAPVTTSPAVPGPVRLPAEGRRAEADRPLSGDRYEIRFTASAATREKLRFASDLLRHAIPDGNTGEIIDRALTALLDELARKKFAATSCPREVPAAGARTRHVPAHVKRAVWIRDEARCAFVSSAGRRCQERGFLEFHHVQPYGAGGAATIENIELRCRAHNGYEAELFYGTRFVPQARVEKGAPRFTEMRTVDLVGENHEPGTTGENGGGGELGPDRVRPSLPEPCLAVKHQSA